MTDKDRRALMHAWKSARLARETGNQDMKHAFRAEVKAAVLMVAQRLRKIAHVS